MSAGGPAGSGCPVTGAGPAAGSDEHRQVLVELTGGEPWTEFPPGPTPYSQYAEVDALLALQRPRTGAATEPAFIIVSQVKELLFTLLHTELTGVRRLLDADRLEDARWTLRRADRVQGVLLSCWDVVRALSPTEFAEFRDILGHASGFQSHSYRRLEFLLGNKEPRLVAPHRNTGQYALVRDQLHQPSVYDAALGVLSRAGLPVPTDVLDRDPAVPYEPHPDVEHAWRLVYQDPEKRRELFLLGEALTDTADHFARWRYTHLIAVQRMLGAKPGTGGTAGVSWLSRISDHRFFPELWSVRSGL